MASLVCRTCHRIIDRYGVCNCTPDDLAYRLRFTPQRSVVGTTVKVLLTLFVIFIVLPWLLLNGIGA